MCRMAEAYYKLRLIALRVSLDVKTEFAEYIGALTTAMEEGISSADISRLYQQVNLIKRFCSPPTGRAS